MSIPKNPIVLMKKAYTEIFPLVGHEIDYWRAKAALIPDKELRKQALNSIKDKAFHCQGGSILGLVAEEQSADVVKFIVAYQTISDYLDNLCDRSTSLDPEDFAALHESMGHSLSLEKVPTDYYRLHGQKEDGGYLDELVETCRSVLRKIPKFNYIVPYLTNLCDDYCNLQIHKHVKQDERVGRLKTWFHTYKGDFPPMAWHEFSACTGSTLGIYCLVAYSVRPDFTKEQAEKIYNGYFPYIQGLHILLDYLIDQEEDRVGGDLNFCSHYENNEELMERLTYFVRQSEVKTVEMPHERFHYMIQRGLLGIYLSDAKVRQQKTVKHLARKLLRKGGFDSLFFYLNGRAFRTLRTK